MAAHSFQSGLALQLNWQDVLKDLTGRLMQGAGSVEQQKQAARVLLEFMKVCAVVAKWAASLSGRWKGKRKGGGGSCHALPSPLVFFRFGRDLCLTSPWSGNSPLSLSPITHIDTHIHTHEHRNTRAACLCNHVLDISRFAARAQLSK